MYLRPADLLAGMANLTGLTGQVLRDPRSSNRLTVLRIIW